MPEFDIGRPDYEIISKRPQPNQRRYLVTGFYMIVEAIIENIREAI
jgi:hypothetical protein